MIKEAIRSNNYTSHFKEGGGQDLALIRYWTSNNVNKENHEEETDQKTKTKPNQNPTYFTF